MQLKLRRSQREGGVLSKSVIFCLDARAEMTGLEQQSITRYKLHNQVIYNSEASKRHLDRGAAHADGSMAGSLKSLASTALAAMNLNITINSLQSGQHIECKSLDELLGAEEALMTACRNLKEYLDTAATFDGREVLIDFEQSEPEIVASATPARLIAPSIAPADVAEPVSSPGSLPPPFDPSGGAATMDAPVFEGPNPFETALNQFTTWKAGLPPGRFRSYVIRGALLIVALFILSRCLH